ncbi:roadblock/LC7 domain-containing protein [Chromobacterium paludis]|uniref:Roadblock/LC7 domain-containing protein n=1 Tax=Chromobacterium paludis TaxID=2605945 RepID=A0A5C1DDW4_9NEIS|nr:roadblock/LC7 domain-containing protein [Chromobacterium paludis]QEL54944.1 roadblock/LC7 domain-containing protein [Chromobacterium paludis]
MDETLKLNDSLYPMATPAGAYFAVASQEKTLARRLLSQILRLGHSVPLTRDLLAEWCDGDAEAALDALYRLQRLDFVHGTEAPRPPLGGNLESQLPPVLAALSDCGRAMLADDNGLYYAAAGFHHETAEEVAALAGDIASLGRRHALLLQQHLQLGSSAWAVANPAGASELAFYPLYIGQQSFVLIIGGAPRLQDQHFVTLVELLARRYA